MFDIGAPELLVLAVLAVILFGPERLPELARKAARVVRYVRTMADNAQQQLSQELGPGFEDVDIRDLNPKAFIQKHLLDDVEPIVNDIKADVAGATAGGRGATGEISDAINGSIRGTNGNGAKAISAGGPGDVTDMIKQLPPRVLTPFDPDAT